MIKMIMNEFKLDRQVRMCQALVIIIGAGELDCPAAVNLASALGW